MNLFHHKMSRNPCTMNAAQRSLTPPDSGQQIVQHAGLCLLRVNATPGHAPLSAHHPLVDATNRLTRFDAAPQGAEAP